MTLPWRGTTPEIASEDDSRYETPGGAQNKVNVSQEYLLHLLKLAVTGLSNGSEAAIARNSTPYGITYDWLKDRLDAADKRDISVEKNLGSSSVNVKSPPIPLNAAIGDNVADDGTAIQNIVNYGMSVGKNIYFPAGVYKTSATITMDRNVEGQQERISLYGDGAGLSIFNYTGSDVFLDMIGSLIPNQTLISSAGLSSYQNIRDLGFSGNNYLGTAIRTSNNNHFKMTNVKIFGFDFGMHMIDMEQSMFENVSISWCQKGMLFEQKTPFDSYSTRPNILNFYGCIVGACLQYGIHTKGGTEFNFVGGMIANNGYNNSNNMSDFSWGIKVEDAGYQGGVACNLIGVYFEDNAGKSDVWFQNNANETPIINDSVYNVQGCSFNRANNLYFSKNNILCTFSSGAGVQKLCLMGSSFKYYGSYVQNVGRKNIEFDGSVLTATRENFESIGCIFKSSIEGMVVNTIAKPFIEASKTTLQSITSGSWQKWQLNTVPIQKNGDMSLNTSTNVVNIAESGVYSLSANVIFSANATGKRGIRIVHSVYGVLSNVYVDAETTQFDLTVSTTRVLSTPGSVYVEVYQSSGSGLNINGADSSYTVLNVTKIQDM